MNDVKARILFASILLLSSVALGAEIDIKALEADMSFFTDASCSSLKPGLKNADLNRFKSDLLRNAAAAMLKGSYDKTYRAAAYQAYPSPRELGKVLKLGHGFSRYENITGMHLAAGKNVIFVGDTSGKKLLLLIPNWMRKPPKGYNPWKDRGGWGLHREQCALKSGLNVIELKKAGNAYISYFDDEADKAPKITVHFATGKVNGFFDIAKHDDKDWDRLLDNAVGPVLDVRGKHIQVAYPVQWFNTYTRSKGVKLINNYDAMLTHHYTLMGLVKYKKLPKNRILARVNFHYYMFRDRDGMAYLGNKGTMRMVADPSVVTVGDPCWGFCHEVGHALQLRQITWGGMTEVSNNILTLYTCMKMGNASRLKKSRKYAAARKNIIQANPKKSYLAVGDVFQRLVPFWQLHLYFSHNGKPDFYADVMEKMRQTPDAGRGNDSIKNQFEFMKICCDVGKTDLTDFFEKYGFFWVGELKLKDYRNYHFKITKEMADGTRSYIAGKKYKKPKTDITLLED